MPSDSRPIVIDLFCGAGGLSEGLEQAGFECRVGVDFDKNAIATFKLNHPGAEVQALYVGMTTWPGVTNFECGERHDSDPSQPHI